MKARWFLVISLIGILCSGCTDQEKKPVYRVGILSGLSHFSDTADGFKEGMRELGYIEGKNILYDFQEADVDFDRYKEILNKFVDDDVDLIFTFPTEASLDAKAITKDTGIPVVFSVVNIENNDIINSVQEPGGNITGVRYPGPALSINRLKLMKEMLPDAKRILIAYQLSYPVVPSQLEILRPAAETLGVELVEVPAENMEELKSGLGKVADVDAVLLIDGPTAVNPGSFVMLAKFAEDHGIIIGGVLVSMGGYESAFGLMTDHVATGKQAASLASKVLQGTPAGTIPVLSAECHLEINYRKAQECGIDVPPSLLILAKKIIR